MKFTLYAENIHGQLFALSAKNTVDTEQNGWLIPDIPYTSLNFRGRVFNAESTPDGLLISPVGFGTEQLADGRLTIDIEILPVTNHSRYSYRHLPIGGGGYVTGFAFDEDGMLFCRTDIGGCYSSQPPHDCWTALSHNADHTTEWLCSPLAITCADRRLYVLFGNHSGSFLGISDDKGVSFSFHPVPAFVHGNCVGRSTGERIAVTGNTIFIGTRGSGLLKADLCEAALRWEKVTLPAQPLSKLYIFKGIDAPHFEINAADDITFVHACGDIIIVGTAESCGVFISFDCGKSFSRLPDQPHPTDGAIPFISQRCAVSNEYLFITYSASASDRESMWYSYACDGSRIFDGRVLRYRIENCSCGFSADITPPHRKVGFSGIDCTGGGDVLMCSTVCGSPDHVFLSRDGGDSWEEILTDTNRAVQTFRTPYMKHENNNGQSVIHWMSDLKLDPLSGCVYVNTGTGVFRCRNPLAQPAVWEDFSDGIEETVHLGIYSPPSGVVRVLDVVGDLGGFAFTDINSECCFTFRDEEHNRYITAINADFAENKPSVAVISPRGNWIGTSKGGAAVSHDGGINWHQLSEPYGMHPRADRLLERIAQPNVNPGWVAVSCDGKNIIRQIADGRNLPADCAAVTGDCGASWQQIHFLAPDGADLCDEQLCVKIFSDRCDPAVFYAFGNHGEVFLSCDCGQSFTLADVDGELPAIDFSSIEGHTAPDIRVSPFVRGEILLCFKHHGILRLHLCGSSFRSERVIPAKLCSHALCGGYGKGGVIFFCGTYSGEYGFWRSFGDGWIRINTDTQQFGQIRSICGDPRTYSRFYIATGSFGALYSELMI